MKRFTECSKGCALDPRLTAKALAVAFIGLMACGDDPEKSIICDPADRNGTYLVTYTVIGGNCGSIAPTIVIVGSGQADDCIYEYETKSADNCTYSSQFTCDDGVAFGEFTSTVTQQTDSGSEFTGTIAMAIEEIDGPGECTSTYRVKYVRQ
jgi:hypothetical protein